MSEKTSNTPIKPRFASQWLENDLSDGQVFTEPSKTVPDQSLTIPEIIARFTRSGYVPATIRMNDQGGNVAAEPDADPLDDFSDLQALAAARAAAKGADETQPQVASESVAAKPSAPADAGA